MEGAGMALTGGKIITGGEILEVKGLVWHL
jgi:hypothetical protein